MPSTRQPTQDTSYKAQRELTPRGQALLLMSVITLAVSFVIGHQQTRLAFSLVAAPLLIDVLFGSGRLRALRVTWPVRRIESGQPFQEHIELHNGNRGAVAGLRVREPRTSTPYSTVYVEHLAGGESLAIDYAARARSRGRYSSRTLACRSEEPLGLIRRTVTISTPTEWIVEPARIDLPVHVLRALSEPGTEAATRAPASAGEFFALREYQPGDDARTVHALRSAATGTLQRTDRRGYQDSDLCIVIDLRRPPGRAPAKRPGPRFEWSLSAAATLIDLQTIDAGRNRGAATRCFVLGGAADGADHEPRSDSPGVGASFRVADAATRENLLTLLADAAPAAHRSIDEELLSSILEHEMCLWIPAGGYRATDERARMTRCVLVSRAEEG